MAEECLEPKNTGEAGNCKALPKQFSRNFLMPKGATIPAATLTDPELLEEFLQNKLIAPLSERWYLMPSYTNVEDASEQAVYFESSLADIFVRAGKYRWRVYGELSMCQHRAIFSHAGSNQDIMFIDVSNQLFFAKKSNGDARGFSLALYNPENLMISDGSNPTQSPTYIVLKNAAQVNDTGYVLKVPFIEDLLPLVDVNIALVNPPAPAAGSIRVSVKDTCGGLNIAGLVVGDFKYTSAAGANVVINTAVPNSDGTYTLTQVGNLFVDGNVDLKAPVDGINKKYESTGAVAVDIP